MFFNNWEGIWRTLIVGVLSYASLVLLLRISGKRTLSKMNAFDLVVTVALGSTLATIILSKDVALTEGLTALGLLVLLQLILTWVSVRSKQFSRMVKATPALLFYRGDYLKEVMMRERILSEEVRAAVRAQGIASMDGVLGVILETDGSFTVINQTPGEVPSSLEGVEPYPDSKLESKHQT